MTKLDIFITRQFPGNGIEKMTEKFDIRINKKNRALSRWELKKAVKGASAIVTMLTDEIDGSIMDAAGPSLKLIANYAVGFDNIDLAAAKTRQIIVTNTPGVLTDSVAEHTIALMLAVARRIPEADLFTKKGQYKQWEPDMFLGQELRGRTLGLIGLGRIGAGVARIAKGLQMETIYFDAIRQPKMEKECAVTYHHFETVLKESDVLSLHVPLLPTTRHLISQKELTAMKPNSILVNTSRGPIVDEQALVHALREKEIWGAGLDVFEHEPKISSALTRLSNVVLTPHIASATGQAREAMGMIVADNVISYFTTGKVLNAVLNRP